MSALGSDPPPRPGGGEPGEPTDREPRYAIAVVAARSRVHVRTVRRYERLGLIEPDRSGRPRLYSEADIDRVARIQRLVTDLGVNMAGVAAILHLREQLLAAQRELRALREGNAADGTGPTI